ncbi:hypothetical protein ACNJ69_12170 [Acinetobacter soli]|uniref:hypothetical protein n=1 Tax=Acinetobacter soli TaxID=487316 RepID=UPI001F46533C|nr:hypothetical protein [Acinetobacter soli]MCE6007596.1 hypothetical protein [Acinetobacter soli]
MRRAAKVDANHAEIVKALRAIGATVQSLATTGKGCPDLLVGYRGVNWLMEVKDEAKIFSQRQLNPHQVEWHKSWRGQVHVIETVDQAINLISKN